VEYLVRIEQGRDRHPSAAVIKALAAAFQLDAAEFSPTGTGSPMSGPFTCRSARHHGDPSSSSPI